MSHLKCLETAKDNQLPHVLIVEDDIKFLDPELFKKQMNRFLSNHSTWDVVIIGGNNVPPYQKIDDTCVKVNSCQTTTGYLVNGHYYDALIDIAGFFKNRKNEDIAIELNLILQRPIIFIDETDNILIYIDEKIMDYNKSVDYTNPFLYYDQCHTIGIDIKQDNYPNLKGLCIIDLKTTYTQTAQGIFRLRKINIGHSVNFIINVNQIVSDIDVLDNTKLIDLLHENDDNNNKEKYKYLIFQILKSEIRKSIIYNKENYKETITSYYFNKIHEYINNPTNINIYLQNINISYEQIQQNKLMDLFDIINNGEILQNLVIETFIVFNRIFNQTFTIYNSVLDHTVNRLYIFRSLNFKANINLTF